VRTEFVPVVIGALGTMKIRTFSKMAEVVESKHN